MEMVQIRTFPNISQRLSIDVLLTVIDMEDPGQ